jgi:hypothetical protein
LNPTQFNPEPKPNNQNRKPSTLNPETSTLNTKPKTQNINQGGWAFHMQLPPPSAMGVNPPNPKAYAQKPQKHAQTKIKTTKT